MLVPTPEPRANEWRLGALHNLKPTGKGFIEDHETGHHFGFHPFLLKPGVNFQPHLWEGANIRFHLDPAGHVDKVRLP